MGLFENIYTVLPEIVLIITACLALVGELFLQKKIKYITLYIGCCGLIIAGLISYSLLNNFKITTLGGLFISDDLTHLMNIFILISVFLCFIYSTKYIEERQISFGDYYLLGLFSTLGMMVLVSAHSLITLYLGLELLSLPLYALTAIRRTDNNAAEAAMKYFAMGAIASGMLLYGFSLLYGATGKLDLMEISNTLAAHWEEESMMLSFSLVFIAAGVGFKLAAAPFHMWAPDVYEGAPSSVTLLISSAPKIAAMGLLFRVLTVDGTALLGQWQQLLVVMALLSTGLGNFLALSQTNIKRLFAYSAIAHIGYALFGILAATPSGYAAALYYILTYSLMSAATFGLIVLLSYNGVEIQSIEALRGLNKRNPWIAFLMLITLFSMAGVPPTIGFVTKLLVLKALVDVHLTWVAVIGVLFAVVGAYYYIKVIKVMYFEEPLESTTINIPKGTMVLYTLNGLSLLYLGLFPAGLLQMCSNAFIAK